MKFYFYRKYFLYENLFFPYKKIFSNLILEMENIQLKKEYIKTQYDNFLIFLRKKQWESNFIEYPIKSKNDKITCIVCNGIYSRSNKDKHEKIKRHIYRLRKLYNYFTNNSGSYNLISENNMISLV